MLPHIQQPSSLFGEITPRIALKVTTKGHAVIDTVTMLSRVTMLNPTSTTPNSKEPIRKEQHKTASPCHLVEDAGHVLAPVHIGVYLLDTCVSKAGCQTALSVSRSRALLASIQEPMTHHTFLNPMQANSASLSQHKPKPKESAGSVQHEACCRQRR